MNVFGSTRSRVQRNHALICPDSFVSSALPGWDKTQGVILISRAMGARFTQFLALMESGASAGPALPGIERVLFVLQGEIAVRLAGGPEYALRQGGYGFVPPDIDVRLHATTA